MTDFPTRSCPEIELLPCPFCGDQAHIYGNEVDFVRRWSVRCNDCNADLDVCEDKQQEAAKAWNTRPVAQAPNETYRDTVRRVGAAREKHLAELRERCDEQITALDQIMTTAADNLAASGSDLKMAMEFIKHVAEYTLALSSTENNTPRCEHGNPVGVCTVCHMWSQVSSPQRGGQ